MNLNHSQFDPRSSRRISAATRKIERQTRPAAINHSPGGQEVEGLLKDDLDEPEELGEKEEQDVQVWVRNLETDKLEKATRNGEEIIIKAVNRVPGESYQKGQFVTCVMRGGEWRVSEASCQTFEDLLD